jgi:serine/threonine-protein kinase HipA
VPSECSEKSFPHLFLTGPTINHLHASFLTNLRKDLGVERFDRKMHPPGKWIMRLPQEDFCQALGVPPHLKYENDGGPGLSQLASVLRGSSRAEEDLTTLLTSQVLFWLMAAPDGHA